MTTFSYERWLQFWQFYKGQPNQKTGLRTLYDQIIKADKSILTEESLWRTQYSTPAVTPKPPSAGLDPRGSEEVGMVGPSIKAPVKPGDSYLLVNDRTQLIKAFDHTNKLLWQAPCLARGQGADNDWRARNTDTPPGLYKIGQIHKDYERAGTNPPVNATLRSYGWYSFDMVELENQEAKQGRAGIMLHGGGTAAGWPGAWAPKQPLYPTHGCLRMHNIDLRDKVLPLTKNGTVYIGVHQER